MLYSLLLLYNKLLSFFFSFLSKFKVRLCRLKFKFSLDFKLSLLGLLSLISLLLFDNPTIFLVFSIIFVLFFLLFLIPEKSLEILTFFFPLVFIFLFPLFFKFLFKLSFFFLFILPFLRAINLLFEFISLLSSDILLLLFIL